MRKVSLVSKFILLFLRGESTPQFFVVHLFNSSLPTQVKRMLFCLVFALSLSAAWSAPVWSIPGTEEIGQVSIHLTCIYINVCPRWFLGKVSKRVLFPSRTNLMTHAIYVWCFDVALIVPVSFIPRVNFSVGFDLRFSSICLLSAFGVKAWDWTLVSWK